MEKYDYAVVGAGLYGAVFARELRKAGKTVLIVEKRDYPGGNLYTVKKDGIDIHVHGAHIFHTDDKEVWEYVNQYAEFNGYVHTVMANYCSEIIPLPFNMMTFNKLFSSNKPITAMNRITEERKEIKEAPRNLEEQAISLVGRTVYEKLIKGYTEKQWGRKCKDLPPEIIKRLPLRFTYDNRYFDDRYQGIPVDGYTAMIEKMIDGIPIMLGTDFLEPRIRTMIEAMADRIVYTGPIDAFYGYYLGRLEYRTVKFETEKIEVPNWQGAAVMNYTHESIPFTRIIEHKWFMRKGADIPVTYVTKEYPKEYEDGDEPYYPINDAKNQELYEMYRKVAQSEQNVIFGGRLGEYRYYDMDDVVRAALDKSKEIIEKEKI